MFFNTLRGNPTPFTVDQKSPPYSLFNGIKLVMNGLTFASDTGTKALITPDIITILLRSSTSS